MKTINLKNFFLIFIFFFLIHLQFLMQMYLLTSISDISSEASNILSSGETREIKLKNL